MDYNLYEKNWLTANDEELLIPLGTCQMCFPLDFPPAMVTKLIVRQASGEAVAFAIDLLNREVCDTSGGDGSSSSLCPTPEGSLSLAKVIPTQQQPVPGQSMEMFHPDGYTARNMEGTFTVPIRRLYLQITLERSTSDTTWEVSMAGRPRY